MAKRKKEFPKVDPPYTDEKSIGSSVQRLKEELMKAIRENMAKQTAAATEDPQARKRLDNLEREMRQIKTDSRQGTLFSLPSSDYKKLKNVAAVGSLVAGVVGKAWPWQTVAPFSFCINTGPDVWQHTKWLGKQTAGSINAMLEKFAAETKRIEAMGRTMEMHKKKLSPGTRRRMEERKKDVWSDFCQKHVDLIG